MLKWFEIFLLFLLAQYFSDRVNTKWIVPIIIGSGVLLSALAINTIIMSSGWTRASVFWQNPNALAIFLALPALFCLAYGFTYVTDTPVKGIGLILISLFLIIGIASTGSRVGMIVLFSGAIVISIILRNRIPILTLFYSLIIFTGTSFTILVLSGRYNFVRRFFPQITIEDGKLVSIQPPQGIEKRFELTKKGIDLWIEQPVFGYGWFSSPEHPTVGFLDFFYIQILVDLGIVGFILVLVFYFQFIREFLSRRHLSPKVIPAVGAGWLIGILAGGIGEAWPRVPRIMFLLILILITTLELEESTKD